jgi:hypothetical protein
MKLFPKIHAPVRRILEALKTEPEVKCPITYRVFTGTTNDPVTGRPTASYTNYAITAIRLRHTEKSAEVHGSPTASEVQKGDIIYMIAAGDFPSGTSLKDKIVTADGDVEPVKSITPVFDMLFNVTVESSKG